MLNYDQPLSEFGYAVNDEVNALICISCKKGVPANMVRSHCKKYHLGRDAPSAKKQSDISQDALDTGLKTSTSPRYTQARDQKPVDGLEVLQGYLCPLDDGRCSQAFVARSSFLCHLKTHHGHPKPDAALCKSPIQTLFAQGGLQKYFAVNESLSMPDPPLTSVYADVLPLLRSIPAPQIKVANNDKERASIHWFTRWPELLEPYCRDDGQVSALRSLASFPESGVDPDWLVRVQDHGCRWWNRAESAHINCSHRASVMLRSHEEYVLPVLTWPPPADLWLGTVARGRFCARMTVRGDTVEPPYRWYLSASGRSTSPPARFRLNLATHRRACSWSIANTSSPRPPRQTSMWTGSIKFYAPFYLETRSCRSTCLGSWPAPFNRLWPFSPSALLESSLRPDSSPSQFPGCSTYHAPRCFSPPSKKLQGLAAKNGLLGVCLRLPLLLLLNCTSSCSILEEACENFLGTGEGKVSDELISLKKYASSLAMREPGYLRVLYDHDYTTLSYRGRNLSLAKLQHGLNELISDTWNRLLAFSGGTKLQVDVPAGMSEDIRSDALGHSFVNEVRDKLPTLSLLREMLKRPKFSLFRPSPPGSDRSFEADPSSVSEFLHIVKPVVESIAFLLQVTGSGPLRMSEVVGDRYCNGSSPRNLFISHGRIFLLRTDLKSSTARGHRSSVVHFPPPKVAELLVYYLTVVRPLEAFLAGHLGWVEEHAAYSEFIYVIKGRPLTPRGFSDIIATYSDRYFGCRLTGLDLRHVLVNIQSTFLPPIVDPSVQRFGDSQAGHGTKTAMRVYGQRLDHLPGEEALSFGLSYHWCNRLHRVLGVGSDAPTPPIPYLHMPSEPTWWSPSDYIPQPTTPENVVNSIHRHITTSLAAATEKLSRVCRQVLREATFEALASMPSNDAATVADQPHVDAQPTGEAYVHETQATSVNSRIHRGYEACS